MKSLEFNLIPRLFYFASICINTNTIKKDNIPSIDPRVRIILVKDFIISMYSPHLKILTKCEYIIQCKYNRNLWGLFNEENI